MLCLKHSQVRRCWQRGGAEVVQDKSLDEVFTVQGSLSRRVGDAVVPGQSRPVGGPVQSNG